MRVKSKYRPQYRDGGRVEPEPPEVDQAAIEATLKAIDEPVEPEAPVEPPVEAAEVPVEPPKQDDATLALKREIERLRQSEQVRRQQAAQQPPMSREDRLAAWQQHGGLSPEEIQFFRKHPEMIDHPQITGLAVSEAKQAGLERGTHAHLDFVEKAFNAHVERLMREHAGNSAMQPTPQFFKPPPGPPARSAPSPSNLVSAPVSRSIPNGSGKRTPGKVTLTPQEVEAARISGVSIEDYAREKMRYAGMVERGEYRDGRDQR